MYLVVIFLGADLKTEGHGNNGEYIDKGQFPEISFEADNKGHYQEIGEIKKVFTCFQSLHIVHDDQVKVQVDNGQDPG